MLEHIPGSRYRTDRMIKHIAGSIIQGCSSAGRTGMLVDITGTGAKRANA